MPSLKHVIKGLLITTHCIAMFVLIPLSAQETNDTAAVKEDSTDTKKTISELTQSSRKIEGLFTFFQDTVSGSVQMLIDKNQLNKEYIHFVPVVLSKTVELKPDVERAYSKENIRDLQLKSRIYTVLDKCNSIYKNI